MTEMQQHILTLMKEIDRVCREQKIRYILHGQTAGCALKYGKFKTGAYPFHIIVSKEEIPALVSGLKMLRIENREFETVSENTDSGMNTVRYVDSATTIFDRREAASYACNGAAVTIHPFVPGDDSDEQKGILARIRNALNHKKNYRLFIKEGQFKTFPEECLKKTKRIRFEGMELPVPENSDQYFEIFFGPEWKKEFAKQMQSTNSSFVIYDAKVPYKKYLEDFRAASVDIDDLFEKIRSLNLFMETEYAEKKNNLNRFWMIAKRSEDKAALSHHYADQMEEMKKLADTGNLDELRSRMTLYLEKEEFYRNEGMSFTVNEELTAIAEMLRQIH